MEKEKSLFEQQADELLEERPELDENEESKDEPVKSARISPQKGSQKQTPKPKGAKSKPSTAKKIKSSVKKSTKKEKSSAKKKQQDLDSVEEEEEE